jgi:Zn-dependent metalloprotease
MIRRINYLRSLAVATLLLAFSGAVSAQEYREAREKALQYLRANYQQFGLAQNDVADLQITDAYQSKHNQLTHVWIRQQHQGIPVFNGLIGLHVAATGKVYHLGHRFITDLDRKVNATAPSMSAAQAVSMAMLNLGIKEAAPSLKSRINDRNWIFEGGNVSRKEIPVSASYTKMDDGTVRLSWMMVIDQLNTSDLWTLCVDAQTGEIVEKINHTVYCVAGHFGHEAADCPRLHGGERYCQSYHQHPLHWQMLPIMFSHFRQNRPATALDSW